MTLFAIFEPKPGTARAPAAIAEKFSWPAFLLPPVWAVAHGLWLELIAYLVAVTTLGFASLWLGTAASVWLYGLLVLWLGFAAPGLREAIMAATFSNPLMIGKGLRDFVADDDAVATPERIEVYRRPLVVKGTSHAIADWFVTGLFGNEEASRAFKPESYRSFQKPALLIWGKEDSVTPLAQGEEIARLLPKAQLSVLDGVNHIPQIEAPEKTASLIAAFVSSLQPPGSN